MGGGEGQGGLEGFFAALRQGDAAAVRAELDRRPDRVGAIDPNPWCCRATALNVAVESGNRATIELLLERGADPNRKSAWWAGGFSALDSVKPTDRDWLLPLLLEHGARHDAYSASRHGDVSSLMRLLAADRLQVNQVAGDGQRPLHVAATVEVAELLLQAGADLEARCVDHGGTPVQYAVGDRPDVAAFLVERGAETDPFLLAALGDLERLGRCVEEDPEVLHKRYVRTEFPTPGSGASHIYVYSLGDYGTTPLHFAAAADRPEAVRWLVEAGADPHARGGYDDQTPAHTAAWRDRAQAIAALAEAGANLDLPSGPQHTTPPVVWAVVGGSEAAFGALLDAGCAIDEALAKEVTAMIRGPIPSHSRGTPESYRRMRGRLDRAFLERGLPLPSETP